MNKPEYTGNSIVNLMSTLTQKFKGTHSYPELKNLPSKDLEQYDSIILIVLDGLGYNYLQRHEDSYLYNHLKGKLTSTFPTTTACANTSFLCGYPAQQTSIHNWFVNSVKAQGTLELLPFKLKTDTEPNSLEQKGFFIEDFITAKPLHEEFNADSFFIAPTPIPTSNLTTYLCSHITKIASQDYKEVFKDTKKLSKLKGQKFIHAYIPDLDMCQHKHGNNSKETDDLFKEIDIEIQQLMEQTSEDTKVIVTSDHGHVDVPLENNFFIEDLDIQDCLSAPPGGLTKVKDFFVRPHKIDTFKQKMEEFLEGKGTLHRGQDLLGKGYYGEGDLNPDLQNRVGDYVVIMNEDYALWNTFKEEPMIGHHGGLSDKELYVPLITFN